MIIKRLSCITLFVTFGLASLAYSATWELYDDFSSVNLDTEKWNDSTGTISTVAIENNKCKIIHNSGHANVSGYLNLIQNPDTIVGIKATITVEQCTGDVRTRIAAYPGDIGNYHVWSGIQLQPYPPTNPTSGIIFTSTSLEQLTPSYSYENLHYASFERPLEIIGNSYTAFLEFPENDIIFGVEGLGRISYKNSSTMDPPTETFKVIGTRSTNGDGPCTVYLDDVYVLRP